ncbi:uncharacterized protein LOC133569798 [Nerophis ophidion]|uniref:uncharacterized protein LOC133569798 n=1 Tax=Nerophis ophidion TaxID=159077 RepID=UPI002ADF4ACB|nr:uncharacterized protein LOC133569798 [Nerophis ophidion]
MGENSQFDLDSVVEQGFGSYGRDYESLRDRLERGATQRTLKSCTKRRNKTSVFIGNIRQPLDEDTMAVAKTKPGTLKLLAQPLYQPSYTAHTISYIPRRRNKTSVFIGNIRQPLDEDTMAVAKTEPGTLKLLAQPLYQPSYTAHTISYIPRRRNKTSVFIQNIRQPLDEDTMAVARTEPGTLKLLYQPRYTAHTISFIPRRRNKTSIFIQNIRQLLDEDTMAVARTEPGTLKLWDFAGRVLDFWGIPAGGGTCGLSVGLVGLEPGRVLDFRGILAGGGTCGLSVGLVGLELG